MSNDIELLACPFCGGEAIMQIHEAHTHMVATFMPDHPGSATVECMGCNVGMINDTVAQVTADWNTRAALAAPSTCQCAACAPVIHASDCAVHNMPALPNGPCDCSVLAPPQQVPVLGVLLEDCEDGHHKKYGEGYFFTADCIVGLYTRPPAAPVLSDEKNFYRGVIAALGVMANHGHKHGSVFHDEIVSSVGAEALYAAAEEEDYAWAGLDSALLTKMRIGESDV